MKTDWLRLLTGGGRDSGAQIQIGWRYMRYQIGDHGVDFAIEPADDGPDVVDFPDVQTWEATAPAWAKPHRRQILRALEASHGKRKLTWRASTTPVRECGRL